MKKCVRQLSFLFVLTIIGITATAQSYNSPYSRFGLGDFTNQNFMAVRGMGNTGSSYANGTTMNPVNPASYSWLNLTTYNVGLFAELSQIKDNKYSERKWTGNLEYGGLAFPLRNFKNEILDPSKKKYKLGMAFFLRPYTRVNYDVTTQETIQDIGIVERRFFGTGGTYNVGWGNSIKFGNFSAGLNLGYLFGQINNNQNIFLLFFNIMV